ncbi:hypothetical protein AOLI_G00179320 [Acnodon oligacanthus]
MCQLASLTARKTENQVRAAGCGSETRLCEAFSAAQLLHISLSSFHQFDPLRPLGALLCTLQILKPHALSGLVGVHSFAQLLAPVFLLQSIPSVRALTLKHQKSALRSSSDVPLGENRGDLFPRQEDYCLVGPVCVCLGKMMGGALLLTQLNGPQAGLLHITVVQRSVNSTHKTQITLLSRFFKDEKRPVLK